MKILIRLLETLFNVFMIWIISSVYISAVKGMFNECGKTYIIEYFIVGNLFCVVENGEIK